MCFTIQNNKVSCTDVTSFSCKCPRFGQAESGQLIAVSRPSLMRSSTYCFRHCNKKTDYSSVRAALSLSSLYARLNKTQLGGKNNTMTDVYTFCTYLK